jgi:hypothetical protein
MMINQWMGQIQTTSQLVRKTQLVPHKHTLLPEKIWCQYQHLYNNTLSNVIVNVASNVSCRPLLEITDAGRSHRYMFLQVFL